MQLKKIEILVPKQYNPGQDLVQFYVQARHEATPILTLYQVESVSSEVVVAGGELLERNGSKENDTIRAYILGVTTEGEPFIFEPYQRLLEISEISVFRFKSVSREVPA